MKRIFLLSLCMLFVASLAMADSINITFTPSGESAMSLGATTLAFGSVNIGAAESVLPADAAGITVTNTGTVTGQVSLTGADTAGLTIGGTAAQNVFRLRARLNAADAAGTWASDTSDDLTTGAQVCTASALGDKGNIAPSGVGYLYFALTPPTSLTASVGEQTIATTITMATP